nr:MAG TPA: hypothetical protein [Caudoviricetes sp.]DAW01543.1 MAG TPA: hypothetical protein [Caudoviricetes sp.]
MTIRSKVRAGGTQYAERYAAEWSFLLRVPGRDKR